jgi:hypothetical protein
MIFKEWVSRRVLHRKDGRGRKRDFENHYQKTLRPEFLWVEVFYRPLRNDGGRIPLTEKPMKLSLLSLLALVISPAAFAETDLSIPGEKWVAKFDKYVCAAFGAGVAQPSGLSDLGVTFETMTTDSTLDNGVIRGSFVDGDTSCRYSAIVLADNAAATVKLVQSKAYATAGEGDCARGQATIDSALLSNNYLYYGHPHNLAIMAPVAGAEAVCGAGATHVGVNFVVAGKIKQ